MADVLPGEYAFSHQYAFFLHDLLADIVVSGEQARVFDVHFDLRSPEDATDLEGLPREQLWDWLERRGYRDVLEELTCRMVCLALLSDFCHFIYEALDCSRKGKVTVCYALLRKPLKENLFYFEWLLADRRGFLDAFFGGDPEQLLPKNAAPRRQKLETIRAAIERTACAEFFDAEYIYDLRYNRAAADTFEGLWNQANHLITTFRHIKTEPQNFNLVFLHGDVMQSQWHFLYSHVPYLLNYTVEVVEALIRPFAPTEPAYLSVMRFRRDIGLLFFIRETRGDKESLDGLMAHLREEVGPDCPACAAPVNMDDSALMGIYEEGKWPCPVCGNDILSDLAEAEADDEEGHGQDTPD